MATRKKPAQEPKERTCTPVKEYMGRSGGAYREVCSECHGLMWSGLALGSKPRYCPWCGARVVW